MHWKQNEDDLLVKIHNNTNLSDKDIKEQFLPHRSILAITKRYYVKFGINRKNRIPLDIDEKINKFLNDFPVLNNPEKKEKSEFTKKMDEAINMQNIHRFGVTIYNKEKQVCYVDDSTNEYFMEDGSFLGNYEMVLNMEENEETTDIKEEKISSEEKESPYELV